MAKIQREFFIPYIKNVCALHLIRKKINERYYQLQKATQNYEIGERVYEPVQPSLKKLVSGWSLLFVFCFILFFASYFLFFKDIWDDSFDDWMDYAVRSASWEIVLTVFMAGELIIDVVNFFGGIINNYNAARKNEENMRIYNIQRQNAWEARQRNEAARNAQLPAIRANLAQCERARDLAESMLEQAYSVNVIPGIYRNIHAAFYLYNWFANSEEDDLGMALNTFAYGQVQGQMDRMIENQGQGLIRQQMELALRMIDPNERVLGDRELERMLAELPQDEREQTKYRQMLRQSNAAMEALAADPYVQAMFYAQ